MKVEIGSRWRPGHRVFRDDETGTFSEVNGPLLSRDETAVQSALLSGPRPIQWPRSGVPSATGTFTVLDLADLSDRWRKAYSTPWAGTRDA